jgi:hypothetical protein
MTTEAVSTSTKSVTFHDRFHTTETCREFLFTTADETFQEAATKAGMVALKALSIQDAINSFEALVKEGKLIRLSRDPCKLEGLKKIHSLRYLHPPKEITDWITMIKAWDTSPPLLIQTSCKEAGVYAGVKMDKLVYQRIVINEDLLEDNSTTEAQKKFITERLALRGEIQKLDKILIEECRAALAQAKAAELDKCSPLDEQARKDFQASRSSKGAIAMFKPLRRSSEAVVDSASRFAASQLAGKPLERSQTVPSASSKEKDHT